MSKVPLEHKYQKDALGVEKKGIRELIDVRSEFQAKGEEYVFLTVLEQSLGRIGLSLELSLSKDGRHFWKKC